MIYKVDFEGQACKQIKEKAESYQYDLKSVLKGIGLLIADMWLPGDSKPQINTWEGLFEKVQEDYSYKDTIVENDFICSISNDDGISIIIEIADETIVDFKDIKSSILQVRDFLLANKWSGAIPDFLPIEQKEIRNMMNETERSIPFKCLHEAFFECAYRFPDKTALEWLSLDEKWETLSYEALKIKVLQTASMLKQEGVHTRDKVASLLNKNTILFVHGAYHAAWCWEEHFIPFFYAHGYNVYAMSFRNHGNSERIENVDQIVVKDMVEDLIKTIDMIDGKIILIAHSLGCRIAQMCLEEIYSSIQSVVLITPMPVRNNFLQLLQMSKKQRKNNLEYILFSERLDSERKEYYMSLLDKESKKVEYAMMKRQKKFSIYVRKIPTLVIGSYNDQCVILQAVKDNAKIHTAELKIVDSVCHDMMLDPDWRNIADLIFKFIEKTIDKKSGDNYNDNYVSTQAHQGGE